jgi:hypothetical protein
MSVCARQQMEYAHGLHGVQKDTFWIVLQHTAYTKFVAIVYMWSCLQNTDV